MTDPAVFAFNGQLIPSHMHAALRRYFVDHQPAGDFLTAVLENNLAESFHRADEENREALRVFVAYLFNEAPSGSWGNPERVRAWLAQQPTAAVRNP